MTLVNGRAGRSRANQDNPGRRKMTARYPGKCSKCREWIRAGELIVVTYEHDRCPGAEVPLAPDVLRGVTRDGE